MPNMTQEELNLRFARRGKGRSIRIAVPEHIKKARYLEQIADKYKMDRN